MSFFSRPLYISSQEGGRSQKQKQLLLQDIHLSGSTNNHRKILKTLELEKTEGEFFLKDLQMPQGNSKREMHLGLRNN